MDLTEFLLARISEDEEVARRNSGEHGLTDDGSFPDYRTYMDSDTEAADDFLARFTPPRVLAECEAKRRMVEAYRDAERAVATYDHAHPTDAYWQEWGNRHALELAISLLALPYADHPGYQQEWAL